MQSVHHLHPRLMGSTRPLRVLLVGAGGSGSAVLLQLPFLEQALRAWGQPGLAVTVMDPDTVSEVNVVRQPFSHVDIGSNKAMCLVGRINMFWGFAWKAIPRYFGDSPAGSAGVRSTDQLRRYQESPPSHFSVVQEVPRAGISSRPRQQRLQRAVRPWPAPGCDGLRTRTGDTPSYCFRALSRDCRHHDRGKSASKLLGRGGAGPAGAIHQSDPGRQFARHACSITAVRANLISRRLL